MPVLHVTGEIDMGSVDTVRAELLDWLDSASDQVVVLDRAGVTFLASSGLALLVEADEQRRDHERAGENFRQTLTGFMALGDRLGEAHARTNLGNVLCLRDEHDQAFEQFGLALDTYRELGSRLGEAYALKGLGVVLAHRGDLAGAVDRCTDALLISQEIDDTALRPEAELPRPRPAGVGGTERHADNGADIDTASPAREPGSESA